MLNFNGVDLSPYLSVTEITGRGPITQEISSLVIPEMPGSHFVSRRNPSRTLTVNFEIAGNSLSDIRQKVDSLNALLDTDLPCPIIFNDEPNKTYYGIVSGEPNWNEVLFIGRGSIQFFCPDPFKYGIEKTATFPKLESLVSNFFGKIVGSVAENGNISKHASSVTLVVPASFTSEALQGHYDSIKVLDNSLFSASASTSGSMRQVLFSFDIIRILTDKYGEAIWQGKTTLADRIAIAKTYISSVKCRWYGYGSSPTGNKVTLALWNGSWVVPKSHENSVVTELSITTLGTASVVQNMTDGYIHALAYAEPSDGTTASFVRTDFIDLEVTVSAPFVAVPVMNGGTADTYPVIQANVLSPITYLAIENKSTGKNLMIGKPVSVEDTITPYEEVILNDSMSTTTGWATGSFAVDSGTIAGTMISDGQVFKASAYGTGTNWHGPALVKSLSQQLQDFSVEAQLNLTSLNAAEVGRVELYLLDVNNTVIGKLAMKDYMNSYIFNMPEIFAINKSSNIVQTLIVRNADENWNSFYGVLRLERIGLEYNAYLARINGTTGKHESVKVASFTDSENLYQTKLAAIGVHIATSGTNQGANTARVHHLTVKKINANQAGIPYIAQTGDVLEFNHQTNVITRNGEDIKSEKTFISDYFSLAKGTNELLFSPMDGITAQIKYKERFK